MQSPQKPDIFVYISDIEPTIQESLKLTTSFNFIGHQIPGYNHQSKALCTLPTALALQKVQYELLPQGFCLVIHDAYRPQKAVDFFIQWSKNFQDQSMKSIFYPYIAKEDVFTLGYVAEKSGHSRGSTIDLTIIEKEKVTKPISEIVVIPRTLANGESFLYADDGTVDMGSHIDLFDQASHHDAHTIIAKEYSEKRDFLRSVMKKHGFKDYEKEWWHYTLQNEPYPHTYFNFDTF